MNKHEDLIELRDIIFHHFSRDEINVLCWELGEDAEILEGKTKETIATNLVINFNRRGKISELRQLVKTKRPNIDRDNPDTLNKQSEPHHEQEIEGISKNNAPNLSEVSQPANEEYAPKNIKRVKGSQTLSTFTLQSTITNSQEWIELAKFLVHPDEPSSKTVRENTNTILKAVQEDSILVNSAINLIIGFSEKFDDQAKQDILKRFVEICQTELFLNNEHDLRELPSLSESFLKIVKLNLHQLLIDSIVELYDSCPDEDIYYFGRLAKSYDEERRKVTGETKPDWDSIISIIKDKSEDRHLHIVTMESLPYDANKFPEGEKLQQFIDALIGALKTNCSTVAARALNRFLSKKENLQLLSENNFNQILATLMDPECHPYTRHGLINCVRHLKNNNYPKLILQDQNLMDLLFDELDSKHSLNPIGAAWALHELGQESPRINERLIDGILSSDFVSSRFEILAALTEGWHRENSSMLLEKIVNNSDQDIRDYSLTILSQQPNYGISSHVIDNIKKLNYPLANKVLSLVERNEPYIISHPHKPTILICVLLKGKILWPTAEDENPQSKSFQRGYIYLGLHLHEFQKLVRDLQKEGFINPKDYSAKVFARYPDEPSDDIVLDFMRRKFGFSEYSIVIQKEASQSFDANIPIAKHPTIIDQFFDQALNFDQSFDPSKITHNSNTDNENDIPIHSVDFMRVGSGYVHPVDDESVYKERIQILNAYANYVNQTFLPGDDEIILFEQIDSENESSLLADEIYEDALTKIYANIFISGIRQEDNELGYCYLHINLSELNKVLKTLQQTNSLNPEVYDATILAYGKEEPTNIEKNYLRDMYGFNKNKHVIQQSVKIVTNEELTLKEHKIVERFFSTDPLNFSTSIPNNKKDTIVDSEDAENRQLHSITSIYVGSGYIYEEEAEKNYENRVHIFTSYANHINTYFGAKKKRKIDFQNLLRQENKRKLKKNNTVELNRSYAKIVAQIGSEKRKMGNYEDAIDFFDKAIEFDDKLSQAFAERGAVKKSLEKLPEAIENFNKAIDFNNKYTWAFAMRGWAKNELDSYQEAINDFDKAVNLYAKYGWAIAGRGYAQHELGNYVEAIADFDKAIEIDDKYIWAYIQRSSSKRALGNYEGAIDDIDKTIELNNEYAWAYAHKGELLNETGKYEEAIAILDRAIELNRKLRSAFIERSIAHRRLGQIDKSLSDIEESLSLNPDSDWSHYQRGLIFKHKGIDDKFTEELLKAVNLAEEETSQQNKKREYWRLSLNIALYKLILGNIDEAEALYNEAIKEATKNRVFEAMNDLELYTIEFPNDSTVKKLYCEIKLAIH